MTFDDFVGTRLPALLRFAAALCADRGTAEDVVQEVLVRAHARWGDIGGLDRPEFYVRRMITNEYLSWRRKWARLVPSATIAEPSGDDLAANDPAAAVDARDQLVGEIRKLPRRQRAVVATRFFADMTDAEIAADLGCSEGTVRSHTSRALATLRVAVTQQDPIGELT